MNEEELEEMNKQFETSLREALEKLERESKARRKSERASKFLKDH